MTTSENAVQGGQDERGELLRALAEQRGTLLVTVREALDGANTTARLRPPPVPTPAPGTGRRDGPPGNSLPQLRFPV
ncbi:hypothetical protein [Streptomyces sp. HB2AG]|uniref:hypothetical protein n=1 Tax=Streptomyces sp. HB2AG TaxID=2983400 RepID=UPI0022AAE0D1|nr:hypothetical protein [Streptomyces sp. HB2AG]MCZ2525874.1 hypothetical protein [Streptomyces sp. HB2AG]